MDNRIQTQVKPFPLWLTLLCSLSAVAADTSPPVPQEANSQSAAVGAPADVIDGVPKPQPPEAAATSPLSDRQTSEAAAKASGIKEIAQGAPVQPESGVPVDPTLRALQSSMVTKQDELIRLEDTLVALNQAWESAELERNGARALEGRMKQTILLETDSFLRGEIDVSGLEQLRLEYAEQREKRQELDEKALKLKGELKSLEQKRMALNLNISERKTVITRLANSHDQKAIVDVRKRLPREISFTEKFSFHCPTSKGLSVCLAEKNISSLVHERIFERYEESLVGARVVSLEGKPLTINESELKYTFSHSFLSADMDINGKVSAEVRINAHIRAELSLACSVLGVEQQLCSEQLYVLTVRSNKYGDQVRVNGEYHGSTPVVLALPKGQHTIQVKLDSAELKKTVKLDRDRVVKFQM